MQDTTSICLRMLLLPVFSSTSFAALFSSEQNINLKSLQYTTLLAKFFFIHLRAPMLSFPFLSMHFTVHYALYPSLYIPPNKGKVIYLSNHCYRATCNHCLWGQLTKTFSNPTEVAKWATPCWSRPQEATENGIKDGRPNWLAITPTIYRGVSPEHHLHSENVSNLCGYLENMRQPLSIYSHSGYPKYSKLNLIR